jgi:transketolase
MLKKYDSIAPGHYTGRNLHFGVREHAMGAVLNGLAESGWRPYGGTFEVFSDYMRPSIRLAALSHLPVVYVFTHDSIFLGEDGPTHQPVEQHWALRTIPNLNVIRPADGPETALAWTVALERRDGPTALLLTRQKVAEIDRTRYAPAQGLRQGGYVLAPAEDPELVIVATGSEVGLALGVAEELTAQGRRVQVVSMPCTELFDEQPEDYRRAVVRPDCPRRMAIEAGITQGWEKYVGENGLLIGLDRFGASAPHEALAEHFGFTVPQVLERIRGWAEELG